ncbi:MAG TPA: inhibitor of sigma-G Gin [Firmicutes bacterium]|uniref:sigma factor G inhibitor Gin n=1 Tax=Gelria sp. Kuro-4 TaxID=2796927 RepID=UPI0019BBC7B1|nr:sigma factor G inhibitor Gin [Gelria sp. Kuro-4]HHV56432.1 inhibitor of sigma-G Gin [Bacillota bacterium]
MAAAESTKAAPAACGPCIICAAAGEEGLSIRGCYICERCEARIVRLQAGDREYDFFRERLKLLWA